MLPSGSSGKLKESVLFFRRNAVVLFSRLDGCDQYFSEKMRYRLPKPMYVILQWDRDSIMTVTHACALKSQECFCSFLKMHLSRGWVMGTMGGGLILRTGLILLDFVKRTLKKAGLVGFR